MVPDYGFQKYKFENLILYLRKTFQFRFGFSKMCAFDFLVGVQGHFRFRKRVITRTLVLGHVFNVANPL